MAKKITPRHNVGTSNEKAGAQANTLMNQYKPFRVENIVKIGQPRKNDKCHHSLITSVTMAFL